MPTTTHSEARESGQRSISGRRRRHLRYALVVSTVLVFTQFTSVLPILRDRLQQHLGIGDREYGLLFGVGPLLGVGSLLAAGALVPRFGPVRIIRACLLGIAGSMVLVAAGNDTWPAVLAGNSLSAVFSGPLSLAASAYLTRLFPGERRRVLALSLAVSSAGGMMIPLVGEGLLAAADRVPALSFGRLFGGLFFGLAAVVAAASFLYRPRTAPPPTARCRASRPWHGFLLPPPVMWLVGLLALHASADSSLSYWMPRFLGSRAFARAVVAPGLVMSGFSLAYLVSRLLLTLLPEGRGRRSLLILPGLVGGGVLLAGVLSREYVLTACGYVLGAFLWSAEYPAMLGALADQDRTRFAAGMALSQVLGGVLTSALTFGIGQAAAAVGESRMWQPMAAAACGFPLVGLGGAWWVLRWRQRGGSEPARAP